MKLFKPNFSTSHITQVKGCLKKLEEEMMLCVKIDWFIDGFVLGTEIVNGKEVMSACLHLMENEIRHLKQIIKHLVCTSVGKAFYFKVW